MLHVALSAPSSKSKHIMTLGLDRKAASSDSATASQTSSYSSKSKDAKPKTLLSCKCTELKAEGLSVVHTVQLLLTSYHEVLVIRKGDKSRNQTVLRRHSVLSDCFMEHGILTTAMQVQVPHTLLRYVYQFEKEKTLRQWLERIGTCRKEGREQNAAAAAAAENNGYSRNGMITNQSATSFCSTGDESESFSPTRQIPKRRDATKLKVHDFSKAPEKSSSASAGARYRQGPGSPEPRPRVQSLILNPGRLKSITGSLEDPTCRSSSSTGHRLSSSVSSMGECVNGQMKENEGVRSVNAGAVPTKGVCQDLSNARTPVMGTRESVSVFRKETARTACSKDVQEGGNVCGSSTGEERSKELQVGAGCSPSMVVTLPEDSPLKQSPQQMGRTDSRGHAEVEVVMTSDNMVSSAPLSPACLSRNSSARSSNKSTGGGSPRSLNLTVLQESLELSCSQPSNVRRYSTASDHNESQLGGHRSSSHRRYSTSSDHLSCCSNQNDAQHCSCSNSHISSSFGGGNCETSHRISSREHLGLNLSEKRNSFVRRASDQLAGLLKMHSFREKERRKGSYVRISSSVSELDTMLCGDRDLDRDLLLSPPRRPHPVKNHSPTTPTSPLMHSRVLSPSTSPEFAGEIPEVSLEGEDEEEESGAFLSSRFRYIQIRNRKRKQSPRMCRAMSTEQGDGTGQCGGGVPEVGGTGEVNRSTSESPISTAARALYQRMELYQSLDNR